MSVAVGLCSHFLGSEGVKCTCSVLPDRIYLRSRTVNGTERNLAESVVDSSQAFDRGQKLVRNPQQIIPFSADSNIKDMSEIEYGYCVVNLACFIRIRWKDIMRSLLFISFELSTRQVENSNETYNKLFRD